MPQKIRITEVGPRDGLQNEARFLATRLKIELIKQLVKAGCKEIEATSFVHPKWIPQLADAEEVTEQIKSLPVTIFALVPNFQGYQRAAKSGIHGITYVLSATDTHSQKNLNRTTSESLSALRNLVERAQHDGLNFRASISTVFGCPFEGTTQLDRILWLIDHITKSECKRISLCDTIGIANPDQIFNWMGRIKQEFSDLDIELHFHNTYGRGLANVYAGIQAGIFSYDSSIGGLGGCPYAPNASGNISTEDLVDLLHSMGIETGINMTELMKASDLLCAYFNKPLESQIWRAKQS